MSDCQHRLLGAVDIARCVRHSDEDAAVWAWSAEPMPEAACPCEVWDRYVVATEHAPAEWLACADVLLAEPRPSVPDALGVACPTGCAIVVIPVPGVGMMLRTRSGISPADPKVCSVCVYPALVMAGALEPRPGRAG
jgi:hypothetical protein